MTRIPFLNPTFPSPDLIAADYAAIVASGTFTNGGPVERALVGTLEDWVGQGVRACVVANCTLGIELAVRALFRPDRPLALVASFTFVAGPLALLACGYQPVFVDADPHTWQPRVAQARSFLSSDAARVGGILLTTTFGVRDEAAGEWEELARAYGLPLIVDSAAGFGAADAAGRPAGARGDCEVFSMHATKMLAAGEGGIITSRDPELISSLGRLRNFGFDADRRSAAPGTNAKLPELTAAIAQRQLAVFPGRLEARRAIVARYADALEGAAVVFQPGAERSAPAFTSALLPDGAARDRAMRALEASGVECRSYYNPPAHRHPVFARALSCGTLEVVDDLSSRVISLPMADGLGADDVDLIAATLRGAIDA